METPSEGTEQLPVEKLELPDPELEESSSPLLGQPTYEDTARRSIAFLLIWILAGLLLASFLTSWIVPAYSGGDAAAVAKVRDEVAFILQQAIGPLITLIGTVCGFYFGRKKNSD